MNSPGQNTGVVSCSLSRGIFPTQGSHPSLLHCRQILYCLSHQENPRILDWVAYPFSREYSQPGNQTGVSCIAVKFSTSWATREASLCWVTLFPLPGGPFPPTNTYSSSRLNLNMLFSKKISSHLTETVSWPVYKSWYFHCLIIKHFHCWCTCLLFCPTVTVPRAWACASLYLQRRPQCLACAIDSVVFVNCVMWWNQLNFKSSGWPQLSYPTPNWIALLPLFLEYF